MNFIDKYNLLETMHFKIKMQATGTPQEFAKSICKSRSSLYDLLDELKEMGADIYFSRSKSSFKYRNEFDINLKIDTSKVVGAKNIFRNNLFRPRKKHGADFIIAL
jgi:predicted peroxiredoxin